MWLPPKDEILSQQDGGSTAHTTGDACGLKSGCYDHPVLILTPIPKATFDRGTTQTVTILIITSFGDQSILERFPRPREAKARRKYLPISPADPHPDYFEDSPVVLELAGGRAMRKRSYANIGRKHNVPLRALRRYEMDGVKTLVRHMGLVQNTDSNTRPYVLTNKSYDFLVEKAAYTVPTIQIQTYTPMTPLPSSQVSPSVAATRDAGMIPPRGYGKAVGGSTIPTGNPNSTLITYPSSRITPTPPLFANFLQAEQARPHALNPGRGTRVSARLRTEIRYTLPLYYSRPTGGYHYMSVPPDSRSGDPLRGGSYNLYNRQNHGDSDAGRQGPNTSGACGGSFSIMGILLILGALVGFAYLSSMESGQ